MSWAVYALALWLSLGLESGFRNAALIAGGSAPSFVVPLVVYVALSAPPRTAIAAAIVAGLLIDLLWMTGIPDATYAGPHALGFALAARVIIWIRPNFMRRHPVTLMVLSSLAMAIAQVVVVSLLSVRSLYDAPLAEQWDMVDESGGRLASALYTALLAGLIAPVLYRTDPVWRFHGERSRRRA